MSNFAFICWMLAYGLFTFDAGCRLILRQRQVTTVYLIIATAILAYLVVGGRS